MGVLETEALVLRSYNLAEADKIVVCLTRSAGLVRGVARGSRKLKNRFGAALEPFTLVNLTCYLKENQELISLRQAEILKSHFDLSSDAETLAGLAYMGDLVMEFSPLYQQNEKLFRMIKACLEAVAGCPADIQSVLRYFEVWLLRLEGFLPDIRHCSECHLAFEAETATFITTDLALHCTNCNHGGYRLSKSLYKQLRATERLAPNLYAEQARHVSWRTKRELSELTHQIIGRALDKPPRLRPTLG